MSNKSAILSAFNKQLTDYMEDLLLLFPDNLDIINTKNALLTLKKMNPKKIIVFWYHHITIKYFNDIINGDINFFTERDYTEDLQQFADSEYVGQAINKFREPMKNISDDDKITVVKYFQNMTKLSKVYNE